MVRRFTRDVATFAVACGRTGWVGSLVAFAGFVLVVASSATRRSVGLTAEQWALIAEFGVVLAAFRVWRLGQAMAPHHAEPLRATAKRLRDDVEQGQTVLVYRTGQESERHAKAAFLEHFPELEPRLEDYLTGAPVRTQAARQALLEAVADAVRDHFPVSDGWQGHNVLIKELVAWVTANRGSTTVVEPMIAFSSWTVVWGTSSGGTVIRPMGPEGAVPPEDQMKGEALAAEARMWALSLLQLPEAERLRAVEQDQEARRVALADRLHKIAAANTIPIRRCAEACREA